MPRELLRKFSRLVRYRKIEAALRRLLLEPLRAASRRRAYRRAVARAVRGPTPLVLVYAMPKVASTSVVEALRSVEGVSVFQVHLISAARIRRLREDMRRRGLGGLGHDAGDIADLGHALDAKLIRPRRPAKVVSLVREPVARNISFYFEMLDVLWQTKNAHENVGLERLMSEFQDRFTHERVLEWFDEEFKPVLGIDVYEHTFPREAGFLRIDSGPYEVLLMRHDLDDRLKEKLLADLVGVRAVSLAPKNVGARKAYSDTYREFLSRVRLSEDYVDRMLGSKYARHFFEADELARLRAKWLGGGRREASPPPPPRAPRGGPKPPAR